MYTGSDRKEKSEMIIKNLSGQLHIDTLILYNPIYKP